MSHPYLVYALKALEIMFFAGLTGCVLVVCVSWVSIFKSGFSKDK